MILQSEFSLSLFFIAGFHNLPAARDKFTPALRSASGGIFFGGETGCTRCDTVVEVELRVSEC